MAQIQGHCDAPFGEVRRLFQEFLESGEELGASIVVNINGRNVVDIWGGFGDPERTHPWTEDTIVNVFSTTKAITSLALLMLVDRGLLDLYAKVAKYWPEFAENGKHDIEVRHFLTHTSGVSGWEKPITLEDVYNLEQSTARLATQMPWWTPGTASGYHSLTYGHLNGELLRRTTGKSLKQFVAEDIAGPLNADFQIGASENDWPRVATIVPPPQDADQPKPEQGSITSKTLEGPPFAASTANTMDWRRADIGAVNGHGNARSVAHILSAITLGGQVDGKHLLSPKTIDTIFQEQIHGVDLVVQLPVRFGMGFGLPGENTIIDWLPSGRICLWGGWGGSIIIMDCDRRMTISYVMNKMENVGLGSNRTKSYVKAVYTALGVPSM